MYSMRINMGVALVAMVDHKAVAELSGPTDNKQTSICASESVENEIVSGNTTTVAAKVQFL